MAYINITYVIIIFLHHPIVIPAFPRIAIALPAI